MTRALPLLAALYCAPAQAQEHYAEQVIAHTLIAEAAFSRVDHIAILSTLDYRARKRGVSIVRQCVLYSSAWRKRDMPARVIDAIVKRPDKYQRVLALVRAYLRDPSSVRDACAYQPRHWGDRSGDLARARRAGWTPVDCGKTANLFWR